MEQTTDRVLLDIYRNEDKKTTTAVINYCDNDAINRVMKRLGLNIEDMIGRDRDVFHVREALMASKTDATVKCNEKDTYNAKEGENEAVKKAMSNHNKSFKKALLRWQIAMIKDIKNVSPETFDEAIKKVTQ